MLGHTWILDQHIISWWLCFTSHRHRDVKLIMWAHVCHVGWTDPTWDVIVSIHIMYVMSLDLRLLYVLKMWNYLLRDYQTLLCNWVVIKVVFGFVKKHVVRQTIKMEFASLYVREISMEHSNDWINKCMAMLRLSVNLWVGSNIVWQKEWHVYGLWWFVWYDLCVHTRVDTSCWRPLSTNGRVGVLSPCLHVHEPIGSHA
jgi:hypothetical protein